MTFTTSAGSGEVAVRCLALGSFAGRGRIAIDPLPPDGRGERAGQDGMDLPDRRAAHRPARVRRAARSRAVVPDIRGPQPPHRAGLGCLARDHRAAALPDGDKPFVGQDGQGLVECRHVQSVAVSYLPGRWQWLTGGKLARGDRLADDVSHLGPHWPDSRRCHVDSGERGMLDERLAGAGEVAAPVQARVEHVQHRTADLA